MIRLLPATTARHLAALLRPAGLGLILLLSAGFAQGGCLSTETSARLSALPPTPPSQPGPNAAPPTGDPRQVPPLAGPPAPVGWNFRVDYYQKELKAATIFVPFIHRNQPGDRLDVIFNQVKSQTDRRRLYRNQRPAMFSIRGLPPPDVA